MCECVWKGKAGDRILAELRGAPTSEKREGVGGCDLRLLGCHVCPLHLAAVSHSELTSQKSQANTCTFISIRVCVYNVYNADSCRVSLKGLCIIKHLLSWTQLYYGRASKIGHIFIGAIVRRY